MSWPSQGLSQEALESLDSPLARKIEFHEEIGSTQERARELARGMPGAFGGASHGTLVVSKVQKVGRGRLGRRWGSPPGGLWMSLVLRPDVPARFAARITQAAAVAVAKALREFGVEARIKWPNDLLVRGRKVCGILAEAGAGRDSSLDFVILGVGLNANLGPEDLGVTDREAATLRSELGHDVNLLELLEAILRCLDAELERLEDFSAILEDWRRFDCTLGRQARVRRFGEVLEGEAVDLSPEGALILETKDGMVELFEGEIEQLRF